MSMNWEILFLNWLTKFVILMLELMKKQELVVISVLQVIFSKKILKNLKKLFFRLDEFAAFMTNYLKSNGFLFNLFFAFIYHFFF